LQATIAHHETVPNNRSVPTFINFCP
jgi:hypothetical protein